MTAELDPEIWKLIDRCAGSKGAHYDVAQMVGYVYKDQFVHTIKDTWYYFSPDKHRWIGTAQGLVLRGCLSTTIHNLIMDRALYWHKQRQADETDQGAIEKYAVLKKLALDIKRTAYKSNVITECQQFFTNERFESLLDSKPHLMCFTNGVYDFSKEEFRDGRPDDWCSLCTGVAYTPYMDHPIDLRNGLDECISKIYTEDDKRAYTLKSFARTLNGAIQSQVIYFLSGKSGSNGKSVMCELIKKAFGNYCVTVPISLITQKRGASNGASPEVVHTKGARFAITNEPSAEDKINTGLMKELTGCDTIVGRGLFKDVVEFKPQFKLFVLCNDLPEVQSNDGGTWRRIKVIKYTSKFDERHETDDYERKKFRKDPFISDKLEAWKEVFASLLIHIYKTKREIEAEPECVKEAIRLYNRYSDPVQQYIDETIIIVPDKQAKKYDANKLYRNFTTWMKGVGIDRKITRAAFVDMVETKVSNELNCLKTDVLYHIIENLNVNNDDDDSDDDSDADNEPKYVPPEVQIARTIKPWFLNNYEKSINEKDRVVTEDVLNMFFNSNPLIVRNTATEMFVMREQIPTLINAMGCSAKRIKVEMNGGRVNRMAIYNCRPRPLV